MRTADPRVVSSTVRRHVEAVVLTSGSKLKWKKVDVAQGVDGDVMLKQGASQS